MKGRRERRGVTSDHGVCSKIVKEIDKITPRGHLSIQTALIPIRRRSATWKTGQGDNAGVFFPRLRSLGVVREGVGVISCHTGFTVHGVANGARRRW